MHGICMKQMPAMVMKKERCGAGAACSLGYSCPERFRRVCPPAYAPDVMRVSLFTFHSSPFTFHYLIIVFSHLFRP